MLIKNLDFPQIEFVMHRKLLLRFYHLLLYMIFLLLFRFRSHTRWHNLVLLLSLLQIMEHELFKDLILLFSITQLLSHQSSDKHHISELVMIFPTSATGDDRI